MASILKLLQSVDPKTRHYIRYYRISEIYEVISTQPQVEQNKIVKKKLMID